MKAVKLGPGVGLKARALPMFENLVHFDDKDWVCSELTFGMLQKQKGLADGAAPYIIDEAKWQSALQRYVTGHTVKLHEPLPEATRDEVVLWLYARPKVRVEYMGRGALRSEALPASPDDLFHLDVVGRGRHYLFRIVRGDSTKSQDRLTRLAEHWAWFANWVNDPSAKIVLSFGGGGFRLFGATTVLKVMDRVVEDRSRVGEVWGSSGGALLGYTYAMGFEPETLEALGYDLYHGRAPHLTSGTVASLAWARVRALKAQLTGRRRKSEMAEWLDELDKKQPLEKRRTSRVPLFALATNPERGGLTALADPRHIPPSCKDFIFPSDVRDAVAASTSVPLILAPQQGITGLNDVEDTWVDGSILDENPLTLPYIKWLREREADPDHTPSKLKVLLVCLNLRSSEFELLAKVQRLPLIRRVRAIRQLARLVDLALDSKTEAVIRTVTESPNVEVYAVKLNLGKLHLHDPRDIPAAIRAGGALESWQFTTWRKFG
jgi:predicted acylesterase/phospholipase RssA